MASRRNSTNGVGSGSIALPISWGRFGVRCIAWWQNVLRNSQGERAGGARREGVPTPISPTLSPPFFAYFAENKLARQKRGFRAKAPPGVEWALPERVTATLPLGHTARQ